MKKAKQLLMDMLMADPRIQKDPKPPTVFLSDLADSAVVLTLWIWTTVEDYWTVHGYIREQIYDLFNENGIEIPFPQVTVHHATV